VSSIKSAARYYAVVIAAITPSSSQQTASSSIMNRVNRDAARRMHDPWVALRSIEAAPVE
jgi:hypothetical protein